MLLIRKKKNTHTHTSKYIQKVSSKTCSNSAVAMNRLLKPCDLPAFTFATSICSLDLSVSWQDIWMLQQCTYRHRAEAILSPERTLNFLQTSTTCSPETGSTQTSHVSCSNQQLTILKTHGARSGRS